MIVLVFGSAVLLAASLWPAPTRYRWFPPNSITFPNTAIR